MHYHDFHEWFKLFFANHSKEKTTTTTTTKTKETNKAKKKLVESNRKYQFHKEHNKVLLGPE